MEYKKSLLKWVIIGLIIIVALYGAFYYYQNGYNSQNQNQSTDWKTYNNTAYGFSIEFPDSWKGYSALPDTWCGQRLDIETEEVCGALIIMQNPQWRETEHWQDIPVMIFTHEQWDLVSKGNLAVSAAPIPPSKLGENGNYVFALPPRWVGFTDDLGQDEAQEITKTFKAF